MFFALVIALLILIQVIRKEPYANADRKEYIQYNSDALIVLNNIRSKESKVEIENYILQVFGENGNMAVKIFTCESGLNPEAINWDDSKITGMPSQGIAQMNRPYNPELLDWKYNIDEAYKLYQKRNWQPWSCYKKLYGIE